MSQDQDSEVVPFLWHIPIFREGDDPPSGEGGVSLIFIKTYTIK